MLPAQLPGSTSSTCYRPFQFLQVVLPSGPSPSCLGTASVGPHGDLPSLPPRSPGATQLPTRTALFLFLLPSPAAIFFSRRERGPARTQTPRRAVQGIAPLPSALPHRVRSAAAGPSRPTELTDRSPLRTLSHFLQEPRIQQAGGVDDDHRGAKG